MQAQTWADLVIAGLGVVAAALTTWAARRGPGHQDHEGTRREAGDERP